MRNITRINHLYGLIVMICTCFPVSGRADIGGGSGRPDSPYLDKSATEDFNGVNSLKAQDAKSRIINFTTQSGKHIYGKSIGVVYARIVSASTEIKYAFIGVVNGESSSRSIDFSVLRRVTIIKRTNESIQLKLELFPDISVDDLLNVRPSYTALKDRYGRSLTIRVPMRSSSGQPLALTGRGAEEGSSLQIVTTFDALPDGQRFELRGDNYWWAISSVTDDLAYPHRLITKN